MFSTAKMREKEKMEKFTPYEKLSKKKKREIDARRRGGWGGINPVTRKPKNPRAYNRKAVQRRGDPNFEPLLFFMGRSGETKAFRFYCQSLSHRKR